MALLFRTAMTILFLWSILFPVMSIFQASFNVFEWGIGGRVVMGVYMLFSALMVLLNVGNIQDEK